MNAYELLGRNDQYLVDDIVAVWYGSFHNTFVISKIQAIKVIRERFDLPLKESKDVIDRAQAIDPRAGAEGGKMDSYKALTQALVEAKLVTPVTVSAVVRRGAEARSPITGNLVFQAFTNGTTVEIATDGLNILKFPLSDLNAVFEVLSALRPPVGATA